MRLRHIPIICKQFPTTIRDEIKTEYPIDISNVKLEWIQSIDVYDPRQVIHEPLFIEDKPVVQILRIAKKTDVKKEYKGIYMAFPKVIEVIKEYTFEEWDNFK